MKSNFARVAIAALVASGVAIALTKAPSWSVDEEQSEPAARCGGGVSCFPKKITAANANVEAKATQQLEVGQVLTDETIYAGVSPGTGKPLCARPADAPILLTWLSAVNNYAPGVNNLAPELTHGHSDWRVPYSPELSVLHENRNRGALKGTFNEVGLYWSFSGHFTDTALAKRFSDGGWVWLDRRNVPSSVRLVRNCTVQ